LSNQQIGQYEIVRELGRGGMGVVYLGYDPAIARYVAIKTILLPDSESPRIHSLRDALVREARAAGSMAHPAIVTVYQMGVESGVLYLAMEYLGGGTLDDRIEPDIPAEPAWAMRALRQIAEGLDYAHDAGFVHRDIKPNNILLADPDAPRVKIADFGLARAMSSMSSQMKIAGTPNYMSPEQINGGRLDGRSDQFALALIAYQLLTGRLAFEAPTFQELLVRILTSEPPRASHLNAQLNPNVDLVFIRALAKNAQDRYEKCGQFISELALALDGNLPPGAKSRTPTVPVAPEQQPISRLEPKTKLNPLLLLLILAGFFGLASIVYLGYELSHQGGAASQKTAEKTPETNEKTLPRQPTPSGPSLPSETAAKPTPDVQPKQEENLSEARRELTKRLIENIENDAPVSALQDLINRGASLKGQGDDSKAPLVEAARRCNAEAVEFLLKQGAHPNSVGSRYEGPLLAVVESEKRRTGGCPARMNIIRTLLAAGASPNRINYASAPAGRAVLLDRSEGLPIMRLLLERGADPTQALANIYDYKDCPKEGVQLLLASGAKVNGPFQYTDDPPLFGAVQGCSEIVELVLAKGANVNAKNYLGRTALHVLIQDAPVYQQPDNFKKIARLLLDHGADPNLPSKKNENGTKDPGSTPLALVLAHHELQELFPTFLDKAGDINRPDGEGRTVLYHAIEKHNPQAVKLLLARGAKLTVRDNHGLTPLALARKQASYHNEEIVKILETAGAPQ
jgi:serine/threonine protein kinase